MKQKDFKYGIVSGSSAKRVKMVLTYLKLDYKKFAIIVGNESYQKSKPAADPILVALKKTKYLNKKDQVVYIGDAKQDLDCAKNAGVSYINIKRPHNKKGDIKSLFELFKKLFLRLFTNRLNRFNFRHFI